MDLLESPQKEKMQVSLLDQGQRKVPRDVDTQKLEVGDTLDLCTVGDGCESVPLLSDCYWRTVSLLPVV